MHDKVLGILVLPQHLQDVNSACCNSMTVTPVMDTFQARSALIWSDWSWSVLSGLTSSATARSCLSIQDKVIVQNSNLYVRFPLCLLLRGTCCSTGSLLVSAVWRLDFAETHKPRFPSHSRPCWITGSNQGTIQLQEALHCRERGKSHPV